MLEKYSRISKKFNFKFIMKLCSIKKKRVFVFVWISKHKKPPADIFAEYFRISNSIDFLKNLSRFSVRLFQTIKMKIENRHIWTIFLTYFSEKRNCYFYFEMVLCTITKKIHRLKSTSTWCFSIINIFKWQLRNCVSANTYLLEWSFLKLLLETSVGLLVLKIYTLFTFYKYCIFLTVFCSFIFLTF